MNLLKHLVCISNHFEIGLLKRAAKNRPDLKVIISSATLEQQKFSQYFDNAETLNISGSCFDVEVIHDDNETVGMDYVKGVVRTVRRIHSQEKDKGKYTFALIDSLCNLY